MTFSIVARCAATGQFGMAIASSSPAVAARCAHVRAGVGAVASQNITDPALGPLILDRLAQGLTAPDALAAITESRAHIAYRQLLVIGQTGATAIHSGTQVLGLWGKLRVPIAPQAAIFWPTPTSLPPWSTRLSLPRGISPNA